MLLWIDEKGYGSCEIIVIIYNKGKNITYDLNIGKPLLRFLQEMKD